MHPTRIDSVDSLRGLASFSVVLDHALMTFAAVAVAAPHLFQAPTAIARILAYTPLHLLWAGHEAVILFYVLSGYVLALPFMEYRNPTYWPFALRRVCRIYLPYLAAIVLSGILLIIFRSKGLVENVPGTSDWFNGMWHAPITTATGTDMLLMLGKYNHAFVTSTWSLVHEMRLSLLFPLIAVFVRRFDWRISAGVAAMLSVIGPALTHLPVFAAVPDTVGLTIYFGAFFIGGAILAKHRQAMTAWLAHKSVVATTRLIVVALILYLWAWEVPAMFGRASFVADDWAIAVGSAVLIMLSSTPGATSRWLTQPLLRWLGDISYSLYLIHPIALLVTVYSLQSWMRWQVAILLVPVFSLASAAAFHGLVERPAMKLGYALTRRFWPHPSTSKEPPSVNAAV